MVEACWWRMEEGRGGVRAASGISFRAGRANNLRSLGNTAGNTARREKRAVPGRGRIKVKARDSGEE